jgi:tRNA threonylcarbamoyladenosine biosynthesis protein TsaE
MEYKLEELDKFIEILKEKLLDKDIVVLLRGDLASGKTTLVKHFIKSLGIKQSVTSPTFAVQSIYEKDIYHYDIYNKELENFISTGLLEEFEKHGIHFVEWGDERLEKILEEYGFEHLTIIIEKKQNSREYTIGS